MALNTVCLSKLFQVQNMDILTSSRVAGLEFLKSFKFRNMKKLTDDTLWDKVYYGLSEQNLTYENWY